MEVVRCIISDLQSSYAKDHEDFEQQNTEEKIIKEQDRQININTAVHMQTGNLMHKVNQTLLAKIGLHNTAILSGNEIDFDLIPTDDCSTIADIGASHCEEAIIAECNTHTLAVRNCTVIESAFCVASFTLSCALQLISQNTTICSRTFNNLASIAESDDKFIVINAQTAVIEEKGELPLVVNGTYLELFGGQLKTNNTIFHNRNATLVLIREIPRASAVNVIERLEILSIPYLHHINLVNLHHIRHLQRIYDGNYNVNLSIIFALSGAPFLLFVISLILKKRRLMPWRNLFRMQ
uniref:Uncharacterized protein n=1 Tax=Glossina pallidipes TaxID=7398 RepID=A0A1A9ZW70_GLOPL